jgi:hypothetical protein
MTATAKEADCGADEHGPCALPFPVVEKSLDLPANPVQLARSKGVNVARESVER